MAKKRQLIAVSVIALSILIASPTLASSQKGDKASYSATYFFGRNKSGQAYAKPSVIGKVSAVSGDSITVKDKNGVAYAVNAANSEVKEGFNKAGSLADIKIGDTVLVQGSLSGSTTVDATSILEVHKKHLFSPRITGTLTSISGSTLSLVNASGTTETIDGSEAKIIFGGTTKLHNIATGTLSSLKINDKVMVTGDRESNGVVKAKVIRDVSHS